MNTLRKPGNRSYVLTVTACILTGFALRFWASVTQPVYSEEAYSIYESIFWRFPYDPSYPPLYPLFLKFWTTVSSDLWWVRFPNVVAGTLSVFVIWVALGKRTGRTVAGITAGLLSFSALHTHYSWVARPHAFMMLFIAVSFWLLLRIREALDHGRSPGITLPLAYIAINALGSLTSYGYTVFLAASFLSFSDCLARSAKCRKTLAADRFSLAVAAAHLLLPAAQYLFIHGRFHPLADAAEWIPGFTIETITSTFLTLAGTTSIVTGELYASPIVSLYMSAFMLAVISVTFGSHLFRISRMLGVFYTTLVVVALGASAISDWVFGLSILQPRLLMSVHIMYAVGLAAAIPGVFTEARRMKFTWSKPVIEAAVIVLLLAFNVRSFVLLNIEPYYNTKRDIEVLKTLEGVPETFLVFPRYEVLTVKYLWGLDAPYPGALRTADKLHGIPADADAKRYADNIPVGVPISVILWPKGVPLTPGSEVIVNKLSAHCRERTYDKLSILRCPPLTEPIRL